MGKRQTRKSISMKAETYERLKLAAAQQGRSVTGYAEETLIEQMDRDGVAKVTRDEALQTQRDNPPAPSSFPGHHFTF